MTLIRFFFSFWIEQPKVGNPGCILQCRDDNTWWIRDRFELRAVVGWELSDDVSVVAQFRHRRCAQDSVCTPRFHIIVHLRFLYCLHPLITFLVIPAPNYKSSHALFIGFGLIDSSHIVKERAIYFF